MFWKTALLFLAALLPFSSPHAGTFVQFRTSIGDIEIELYDADKPVTVTNFLYYVKQGYTNDMFIHRFVPNFVIQGGLSYVANRQTAPSLAYITTRPQITNEYRVGRTFSNTNGTIAMARVGGLTNSATSQWFINLGNNSGLDNVDGGFTVFGRTIRGFDVLASFSSNSPQKIWRYSLGSQPFTELPATRFTTGSLTYDDLVYVDITLLNVRLTDIGTGKQIVWRSVKDKVNYVEYTTVFPPVWQTLATPTGTGNDMTVTDNSGDTKRFYRIRADF
ncbi:MAG: peptidylprolyl isomerase [Verrucomicrobiota bacterium]